MGDLPQNRVVLAFGRRAGRSYLWLMTQRERGRIRRAHLPDRLVPARATFTLVRLQRGLFAVLILLILAGFGVDALLRHEWGHAADALGIKSWLQRHVTLPSSGTLRSLLAASAAGTATVLGLVLSISLIVWQATADRYRSSTIVAFLLRERLGRAFVRLLALAFAYSLWVLALLELTKTPPYASAAIALLLTTGAVLSLISYREIGLLGYLPERIGQRLGEEIVREIFRAQREHAGPSVENHSRLIVEADLQIFEDLLKRLRNDGEVLDIAACLSHLERILSTYLQVKQRASPQSRFFATRKERLGPYAYAIEESVGAAGLLPPTTNVSDRLWLERRVLEVTRTVETKTLIASEGVALALIGLWARGIQHAWFREDPDALELLVARAETATGDPGFRATESVAEELAAIPWLMVEAAGRGVLVDAAAIVELEPWTNEEKIRTLPWSAQQDARDLAQRIRLEDSVTGGVVTPVREMIRELSAERESRTADAQRSLAGRAIALARSQLQAAISETAPTAPVLAQRTLGVLLRVIHHDLELPELGGLTEQIYAAAGLADEAQIRDMHETAGRAARVLAQREQWTAAYEVLWASEAITFLARSRAVDPNEKLRLFYDGLLTAAIVHGWGEYHQRADHVLQVGQYVQSPYADLDVLASARANHRLFGVALLGIPSVVHYQWAQPLLQAANALPERPVADGGIGYSLRRDHPSSLFAGGGLLGIGPSDCLVHLIDEVVADRRRARQDLLETLEAVIQKGEPTPRNWKKP